MLRGGQHLLTDLKKVLVIMHKVKIYYLLLGEASVLGVVTMLLQQNQQEGKSALK